MLAPLRDELKKYSRDGGKGVLLYDVRRQQYVRNFIEVVNGSHDLVGLPKYSGHANCGSKKDACLWCRQPGKRFLLGGATCYPGAVRFLPSQHALRKLHGERFAEAPDSDPRKIAHTLRAPKARTREMAEASMSKAEAVWKAADRYEGQLPATSGEEAFDKADKKNYNRVVMELKSIGFLARDVFSGEVPSHEPVAHSHYCTPHLVGNVVKDIFRFVSNQGDKAYKKKYQLSEREATPTRFENSIRSQAQRVVQGHKKYKHMAHGVRLVEVEGVLDGLRLWKGLDMPRLVFSKTHKLKTSECVTCAGSIGAYIIHLLALPKPEAEAFKDQFFALEHMVLKHFQELELPKLQGEVAAAWTDTEMLSPTFMSTLARHMGLHVVQPKVSLTYSYHNLT
jgi:hypothetical protein